MIFECLRFILNFSLQCRRILGAPVHIFLLGNHLRLFPNRRGLIGRAMANSSCHCLSFPNSLIRAKNRLVKNGTANFDRIIPTEISGPPPEVIPNIPVGRNRNGPFHLNSDRNFRNLWHNGKHPLFFSYSAHFRW